MDSFNLPLLLCAAASTLAFVTITSTSECSGGECSINSKPNSKPKSKKWKGEGGSPINPANILDDNNLQENISSGLTLFIDLHAEDWCGHCKDLAPIWDKFMKECTNLQTIKIMKCDADKNTDCSTFFKVESYPTIVLYKDGKITNYKGERTSKAFCEFLKTHCK